MLGPGILYDGMYFNIAKFKDEETQKKLQKEYGTSSDIVDVVKQIIAIRNGEDIRPTTSTISATAASVRSAK